ncbi:MAG: Gfo/Idh/MocA family oxidoreductase, partial [Proteobacteria bacterium]|nr:Gfo/Idh/MocA family oxidoreductase [Pseudomonadota bacterium]
SPKQNSRLDIDALISHRFPITDAEAAYELVTNGTEAQLGVVLTYPTDQKSAPTPKIKILPTTVKPGDCVLGVIGAGNFARATLLPALKKLNGVELHTVVSRRGSSAEHSQQKFGFREASADEDAVINNPEINAVVIATRHDSHAALTAAALRAGKSVYVEKPLGLSHTEIDNVAEARDSASGFLQVGFNRRFAPLAQKAQAQIAGTGGTKFVLLRVNAGAIPADSWIHAPGEGGGRIIGEVCHFVDLARYFVGAPLTSVQADSATSLEGVCDDVTATLRFTDGSLATIAYTALGDDSYPKERFEIYAGGSVVLLDNFRRLSVNAGGSENVTSSRGQDKGHNGSLSAFVTAVTTGGPAPIDENELFETSRATLAILDSLQQGTRIDL